MTNKPNPPGIPPDFDRVTHGVIQEGDLRHDPKTGDVWYSWHAIGGRFNIGGHETYRRVKKRLRVEDGKFYRMRNGAKIGPMKEWLGVTSISFFRHGQRERVCFDAPIRVISAEQAEKRIAELEARVKELEEEKEANAWTITPAMAEAKIDQLNAQVEELSRKLAEEKVFRRQVVNYCDQLLELAKGSKP